MNLPVWLYWEGDMPAWISKCHETVFAHGNNVQLIDPVKFDALRDSDRDIDLSKLCTAHRADFIRAFLLAKFGGLWIDSDCIVMQSLLPLLQAASEHDFTGYKERGGYVSNNFMAAKPGGVIAASYYNTICNILRSNQKIEWLTLGSNALTSTINKSNVAWLELNVEMIQPVCWSDPKAFFTTRSDEEHEKFFNASSYCYMLSANMVGGYANEHPGADLFNKHSFFMFLLKRSNEKNEISQFMNIAHRKNTDDDHWVIPEVIHHDMYRIKNTISKREPPYSTYVIDCGAHIGAFSVMCSTYLKNAEVISFEPNPDSFFYLNKNAQSFGDIQPYQKAVDFKDSTLSLYPPDQSDWSGRWSCLPNANEPITVESINLFSFIKNLDKPVFIVKMDLEGYEEMIINNATAEDLSLINTLILETHTDGFDHQKLTDAGFRLLFHPDISSARQFVYAKDN